MTSSRLPARLPSPLLVTACLGLLALLGGTEARAGTPLDATTRDYDQTHVAVHVTPYVEEGRVDVETTIRFASLVDPLKVLRLHLVDSAVLGVKDGEGTPLEFSQADGILSVTLAKPTPKGAEAEVTVKSRSRPTAGLYFHAPSKSCPDMPLEMYSQGEGTDNRRWFPCYDEPDDRATCEVFVTVPKDLKSVANGTMVESKPVGDAMREDHWKLDQRIPTYLISLIVGKFESICDACKDVPLDYNGPVGRAEEIRQGFSATKDIMDFFTDYTGRKFPYPRYAQTTVWDFVYGGMENAGATTMNMRLLHPMEAKPNYSPDNLVAHEMAHQWFGDLLTCKTWDHLWLNEGFATYFADLFFEHRDGAQEFALDRWQQNRGYMNGSPKPETLGLKPSPRGDIPLELHGGKQYDRGAAILHQLRIELGDEVFRNAIRRYVKENEDKAVVSDDLKRSVEAEAGRSLDWFFDQWVYGAGYPVLAVSYTFGDSGNVRPAHVTIDQTQTAGGGQPEAFRISVPYRFGTGPNAVTGRFDVRRRHQVFDIPLPGLLPGSPFLRVGDGGGTLAKVELKQELSAWIEALAQDTDVTGRIAAAEALADWPDAAVPALATAVRNDKSWAVRTEAAKSLGQISGPAALEALLAGVADADARVREAAIDALGNRMRKGVGAVVTTVAKTDPSPYVRAAAARAVGKVHADGAFETLSGLLSVDSHRETVRSGALDGLKELGDRRAIELAHRLLPYNSCRGDHHGMRHAALDLLLALAPDEPETHADVVVLLSDPFHRMRIWAAEAAGKFQVRSAEGRLREMADRDPDNGVKGTAKAALEKLAGK